MNGLNNFDKTDREHSLAPTDDLIRFSRSKIKVSAGLCDGVVIHIDAGASTLFEIRSKGPVLASNMLHKYNVASSKH